MLGTWGLISNSSDERADLLNVARWIDCLSGALEVDDFPSISQHVRIYKLKFPPSVEICYTCADGGGKKLDGGQVRPLCSKRLSRHIKDEWHRQRADYQKCIWDSIFCQSIACAGPPLGINVKTLRSRTPRRKMVPADFRRVIKCIFVPRGARKLTKMPRRGSISFLWRH